MSESVSSKGLTLDATILSKLALAIYQTLYCSTSCNVEKGQLMSSMSYMR